MKIKNFFFKGADLKKTGKKQKTVYSFVLKLKKPSIEDKQLTFYHFAANVDN